MQINGVVFDLDHTLFDRYATLKALTPDFCDMLGDYISEKFDTAAVADLLCEGDKKFIYFGWRKVFYYLCDKGMFSRLPEYEQYGTTLLKLFTCHAVPYPFTYSVLDELRASGYKTGLITNGSAEIQRCKVKLLKLENSFDEIILCGEFGVQKPDVAPFKEMARRLGVPENTLVYVGDNPVCDVEGSRNAGYTPIEVLTADCTLPDAVPAKYRINSVAELFDVLNELKNA